jgi:predicted phosphoribosyltransferase
LFEEGPPLGKTLLPRGVFLISFVCRTGYILFGSTLLFDNGFLGESKDGSPHVKEGDMTAFRDRREAGKTLAQRLSAYSEHPHGLILALPRGGVPVAYEVAGALTLPLDIFIVRKLGLPGREELAIGAIATRDVRVLNKDIIRMLSIPEEVINLVAKREGQELQRREKLYRGDRPPPKIRDRTIILIDDGLATGASMRAAVAGLRAQHPARIVVAVPAAAAETCDMLKLEVDEVVCAITPEPFYGVGRWYEDFSQVTDEEVRVLLQEASRQLLAE